MGGNALEVCAWGVFSLGSLGTHPDVSRAALELNEWQTPVGPAVLAGQQPDQAHAHPHGRQAPRVRDMRTGVLGGLQPGRAHAHPHLRGDKARARTRVPCEGVRDASFGFEK
jgi:hypothetical protein